MRWLWVLGILASCDYVYRLDKVPNIPGPDGPFRAAAWRTELLP